ncbi:MAG: hypothetical protein ACFFD4_33115 [Candidatus Odinarchaeota archaeon]
MVSSPDLSESLPFKPYEEKLKTVIRKVYIKKVTEWLLGRKDDGFILAEASNSSWEIALSIIFFADVIDIRKENDEEKEFCESTPSLCADVTRRLLRKKKAAGNDRFIHWDGVTWDTAVVIRAILRILLLCPDRFSKGEKDEIFQSAKKSLHWLFMRFEKWEKEIKYPFGPADVSQILITICFLKENFPDAYSEIEKEYSFEDNESAIEDQICKYLLHSKTVIEEDIEGIKDIVSSWGDFFQTAEVLESLVIYYRYLDAKSNFNALKDEIKITIKQVHRYIEYNQEEDGMWGTHIDTIRTLGAYTKASKLMPFLDVEHHIVFKPLRWICDEKQCFSDGSFLHTMFLTIFMCGTIVEIHNNWSLADYSIAEVYDTAFWCSPVRTSVERTKRFATELKNEKLIEKYDEKEKQLNKSRKRQYTISLALASIIITFFAGLSLGAFSIANLNLDSCIALVSITISVYLGIIALLWTNGEPLKSIVEKIR